MTRLITPTTAATRADRTAPPIRRAAATAPAADAACTSATVAATPVGPNAR